MNSLQESQPPCSPWLLRECKIIPVTNLFSSNYSYGVNFVQPSIIYLQKTSMVPILDQGNIVHETFAFSAKTQRDSCKNKDEHLNIFQLACFYALTQLANRCASIFLVSIFLLFYAITFRQKGQLLLVSYYFPPMQLYVRQ